MTEEAAPADDRRAEVFAAVAAVRTARTELVDRVRAGDADYDEIYAAAERDAAINTMKLLPAIEVLPEVGKVQSRRALGALELSERILVGDVDDAVREPLRRLLFGDRL